MQQFDRIAALGNLRLSSTAQQQIQALSKDPITFWENDAVDAAELYSRAADADAVLLAWGTVIDEAFLQACPRLQYIGVCSTSVSDIDIAAVEDRSIAWSNVSDYADEATAEWVFGQLLILLRGDEGISWKPQPRELFGKRLGVIGLGAVGRQIAQLGLGFRMQVQYHSRSRQPLWEEKGVVYSELHDLLATSDVVSLSVPRNTCVLDAAAFDQLRNGAIFVNTSIGDTLDEAAFLQWSRTSGNYTIMDGSTGQRYHDLFAGESNVIYRPEIAGLTQEALERMGMKVVDGLQRFLADGPLSDTKI